MENMNPSWLESTKKMTDIEPIRFNCSATVTNTIWKYSEFVIMEIKTGGGKFQTRIQSMTNFLWKWIIFLSEGISIRQTFNAQFQDFL